MPLNQHKLITLLRGVLIGGILFLVFPLLFAAQTNNDQVGEVSASFLQINPSVRMAALGGDQAAAHGSLDAMYSNPAGLSSLVIPELNFSHNQSFLSQRSSVLGLGLPLGSYRAGVAVQHQRTGTMEKIGIDSSGDPITGLGDFRYSNLLFQGALSRPLFKQVTLGLGLKGWQENFGGPTSNGWAADIGLLMPNLFPQLDAGIVVRNLGPTVDGENLPLTTALGLAYHFPFRTTLFTEMNFSRHTASENRTGVEWTNHAIWIRGGYNTQTSDLEETLSHFSFGAGIRLKGWRIDYGFIPRGLLGDEHRFSLSLGFGLTPEEREHASIAIDKAVATRMKNHANQFEQKGNKAYKNNKWDEAVQFYAQTLEWDSTRTSVKEKLEQAQEQKRLKQASAHYVTGLDYSKNNQWLEAAYHLKQALTMNPNHKAAADKLKEAEKMIGSQSDAKFNQAVDFYVNKDYGKAISIWTDILKKNPDHPRVREYIEKARRAQLEQKVAQLQYEKTQTQTNLNRLSQKAYTLYSLGQIEEAIKIWKRILALDPNNADASQSLKEARAKQELHSGSTPVSRWHRVVELDQKAMMAYQSGRLQKASDLWHQALLLDPGNKEIQKLLDRIEHEKN